MQKYLCFSCKNYLTQISCLAYPNGIPEDIIAGTNNHEFIQNGQVGEYIFEQSIKGLFNDKT